MQNPLITVGIPSYNHAKFLAKALDSATKQTYSNLEIIVVDNYSSDGTDEVLSSFNDPRISIVKVSNGGSIAVSRNIILNKSQGEWVAFLDSDDWWTLDKLDKCSKYFREGIDLIYHNLIVINENKKMVQEKIIKSRKLKKPVLKDLLINGNTIATSSVVVRRVILSKVKGMNESIEMLGIEDFNAWLKISQITDGFKLVSKNLGYYRIHNNNTSQGKKFLPPTAAFIEFLPLLSKKEMSAMNFNYTFANARLSFMAGNYIINMRDLGSVVKNGRLTNRIKAICMYIVLFLKIRKN